MTGTICDICGNIVLSGTLKVVQVKFGERTERVHVCERCWRRDREAPEKYIRKHFEVSRGIKVLRDKIVKHPSARTPLGGGLNRGVPDESRLRILVKQISLVLRAPVKWPLKKSIDVPTVREDLVNKLIASIGECYQLAVDASKIAKKGEGAPTKTRYYQLVGYLSQVLDGILENVELDELKARMDRVEAVLHVKRKSPPKA